jgi:hypothetical protein
MCGQTQSASHFAENTMRAADEIWKRSSNARLVALSDTFFEESHRLLLEVLDQAPTDITYLALGAPRPQSLVDLLIRKKIREINESRRPWGQPPIEIVELDLSSEGLDQKTWFLKLDNHMYEKLKTASENFTRRGILFVGGASLFRSPLPLPFPVESGESPRLYPLGWHLEQDAAVRPVMRKFWVDHPFPREKAFKDRTVPDEWRFALHLWRYLKPHVDDRRVISVSTATFQVAEGDAQNRYPSALSLATQNFDFVRIDDKSPKGWIQSLCEWAAGGSAMSWTMSRQ